MYTGDVSGAGTGANVFIVIYGAELNTGECILAETKKKKKGCFERGSTDQFVKEVLTRDEHHVNSPFDLL